ncbi:MAG: YkvA family protein [Anaerolineae bacterium]
MSEDRSTPPRRDLAIGDPLGERVNMLVGLVRRARLGYKLFLDPRVSILLKALPVAALTYVAVPIDLVPEFLIGLGVVDDLAILTLALEGFIRLAPPDILAEHARELGFLASEAEQPRVEELPAGEEPSA